jgi:hypothetical protein
MGREPHVDNRSSADRSADLAVDDRVQIAVLVQDAAR